MTFLFGSWELIVFGVFVGLVLLILGCRFCRSTAPPEPVDATAQLAEVFLIRPYLQLGNRPQLQSSEAVELFWHSTLQHRQWSVQVKVDGERNWRDCADVGTTRFAINGINPSLRHHAVLDQLLPGQLFEYRILADGALAFLGSSRARQSADQPFTFAVVGDLGKVGDKREQRMSYRVALSNPDMVVVPGDIVYDRGRVFEYLRDLFPAYNNDEASEETGAPLLRSALMFGAPGNHDIGMPNPSDPADLDKCPDLYGYFMFWSQPLNGHPGLVNAPNTPALVGSSAALTAFLERAGGTFPCMANFSFDWGNSHWVVLDSNAYMDWTDTKLQQWLEADFNTAADAMWRFVTFHHPGFSSDRKHAHEQRMRFLCPIFERHKVDVVFNGHNHCYERGRPLRFQPQVVSAAAMTEDCPVPGSFAIDTEYDGDLNQQPDGVIYIIDGAGGAKFYPFSDPGPNGLKPYTVRYDQSVNSFTHCQIDGNTLIARQISQDGDEIDRFVITK